MRRLAEKGLLVYLVALTLLTAGGRDVVLPRSGHFEYCRDDQTIYANYVIVILFLSFLPFYPLI
ncbi:hypothetical protein BDW67DRAFT_25931 [Aspergillus spinulosporus]